MIDSVKQLSENQNTSNYLNSPQSQPAYRGSRNHKSEYNEGLKQRKYRKEQNFILEPLLENHKQTTTQKYTLQLGSILSSKDSSVEYLKINKLMRVTKQLCENPNQKVINLKKPIVFTPQQKLIILLNLGTILVIYMYFTEIPISIAFQNHRKQADTQRVFQYINIPALLIFVLGSFIKARTAYFEYGILISDTKLILFNYLKKSFVIDLLSIGSIIVYEISEIFHKGPIAYRFIILLFYLKLRDLNQMQKYVVNQYDLNRRVKATLKLLLLLTKIFLLSNIFACGFFYLSDNLCREGGYYQYCDDCCWITATSFNSKIIRQSQWSIQYSYSIYWAITTMISVGYGDITPRNPYQISYTVFIEFISCLVYAYSLNTIWDILQQLNNKKNQIRHRITVMNTYMRDKKISPQLKSKVKAYLLHFYHAKNVRQKDIQNDIISDLTPSLKTELFYQSYGFIFRGHSFFKNFTAQALQTSSQKIIESGYFEEQSIFSPESEECTNMLFYIQKGEVENYLQLRKNKVSIRKIYVDETVGLKQFITQLNYRSNLVANKYSVVYQLKFQDWKSTLNEEEQDFQKFYTIKQKVIFCKSYEQLDIICQFCRDKKHLTEDCFQVEIEKQTCKFLKRYKTTTQRRKVKRQNTRSSHISSRISAIQANLSAFQSIINNSQRKMSHISNLKSTRKQSIDFFATRKDDFRQKKIVQRNQKIHRDIVDQIKNKIQYKMQGQDFEDLYSQNSEMLSTDNIVDKVQNYDWYFPKHNADQEIKTLHPKKRMTMLKIY